MQANPFDEGFIDPTFRPRDMNRGLSHDSRDGSLERCKDGLIRHVDGQSGRHSDADPGHGERRPERPARQMLESQHSEQE